MGCFCGKFLFPRRIPQLTFLTNGLSKAVFWRTFLGDEIYFIPQFKIYVKKVSGGISHQGIIFRFNS